MIQGNQLRIGNFLLEGSDILKVGNIYPNGFDFIYESGCRFVEYQDIKPILITEEILLKCKGFTGSGERFEFEYPDGACYPFALIYRHGHWNLYDTSEDYCITTCSFLHELQNIYYWALGKKELEINL